MKDSIRAIKIVILAAIVAGLLAGALIVRCIDHRIPTKQTGGAVYASEHEN